MCACCMLTLVNVRAGASMLRLFVIRVLKFTGYVLGFGVLTWALHNGIEDGWFGHTFRLLFGDLKKIAVAIYEEYSGVVGNAGPALGIAATLLSGVWAIHKGLYFANHNLPDRLQEYLDRRDDRLREVYANQLAMIRAPLLRPGYGTPPVSRSALTDLLRSMGFGKPKSAQEELRSRLAELSGQVETAARYHEGFSKEKVQAHILLGATLVADAEALASGSVASGEPLSHRTRQLHQRALDEFNKARAIDGGNLDALELRAAQLATLGEPGASEALAELRSAAVAQHNPVRQARALRLMAERYEQSGVRTHAKLYAVPLIREAEQLLADRSSPGEQGIDLEKALTFETAGRIRQKIGQLRSARTNCGLAIAHYRNVPTEFARAKAAELEAKLKSLGSTGPDSPQP